ncbi:MAG: lipoyl synthase [Candidatus Micrarchaeota archaeon]
MAIGSSLKGFLKLAQDNKTAMLEERMKTQLQKPAWLKIRPPTTQKFETVLETLKANKLHTVCEEAHCPNISECWSSGTATFMVLGDTCTRGCRFCNVRKGRAGIPIDPQEPENLAKAVKEWGLTYVVITSVDRDDLPDQGANHFAQCIRELRKNNVLVEVLIPDFRGNDELLKIIVDAKPNVIAHNIETIERLQKYARDYRANYWQSIKLLKKVKEFDSQIFTKTSIMLGLGEKEEEVLIALKDLTSNSVDVVTFGQYLRPSIMHLPVTEYVAPEKFEQYNESARKMGFLYVAGGPFIRSSYKAGELFMEGILKKGVEGPLPLRVENNVIPTVPLAQNSNQNNPKQV